MIGAAHAELLEEEVAQARVVVLPRVHEHVSSAQAVELLDDAAETDDLRPRAQNRHDFHASMSSS